MSRREEMRFEVVGLSERWSAFLSSFTFEDCGMGTSSQNNTNKLSYSVLRY